MVSVAALFATPTLPAVAAPTAVEWDKPGPHQVQVQTTQDHTLYFPAKMDRHPVIIWGNGSLTRPSAYDALLRHWASHGFIVAAANTVWATSGVEMLQGIDLLTRLNQQADSPFHQKVDLARIGASGHSRGGGGSLNAGADPRVDTTAPIQPGPLPNPTTLRGPTFLLAGANDTIVEPAGVEQFYEGVDHVIAIYGSLAGTGHFAPLGDGDGYRGPTTAWFAFQLRDDERARGEFFGPNCGICKSEAWSEVQRNRLAQQVPGPSGD
ncbi:acetylxylan esterase [Nocardia sp. CDC159]|uniref:Acetylxylan esterase n=1 Tax=Nocardia pulmonis TaxID=2951408 RepID=A0A9X2EG96_9NOCA|nr:MULTISPECIES: acetylxylan esterase [Nocardia]MCM6778995.1 acetylxylan esterase [Nocardia pulmonis]MCM6791866.1 acetylxylan esterase [Nocardia sp. CDC159]